MKLHHFIISVLAVAGLCAGCNEQSKISVNVLTPETTADLCSDHLDNDDNGKADCDEDSCQKFEICGGTIKAEICDNWMDDDGDGMADCGDTDCASAANCKDTVVEICDNWMDDDGDGMADCGDTDCASAANCKGAEPQKEICDNNADDDGDGKADCQDEDCASDAACKGSEPQKEICDNNADDDGDGKADCQDEDCASDAACKGSEPQKEICDNNADDDGDEKADCQDEDCASDTHCKGTEPQKEICDNDADDDGDGNADCQDEDCASDAACAPKELKNLKYKIGLVSDIHFDSKNRHNAEHIDDLVNAIQYFRNNNVFFIANCGDIAEYEPEDYKSFNEYYLGNAFGPTAGKLRLFTAIGNHDYLQLYTIQDGQQFLAGWLASTANNFHIFTAEDMPENTINGKKDMNFFEYDGAWNQQYTEGRDVFSKLNYWLEKENNIFVFLSLDYGLDPHKADARATNLLDMDNTYVKQMEAYVADTDYDKNKEKLFNYQYYHPNTLIWLKDIIENNTNKHIFVFTHHFITHKAGNGVPYSGKAYYSDRRVWPYSTDPEVQKKNYSGSNSLSGLEFHFINKLNNIHKNVIWFSGHTHYQWEDAQYDDCLVFCNKEFDYVKPTGDEITPLDDFNNLTDYKRYTRLNDTPKGTSAYNVHIPSLSKPTDMGTKKELYKASQGGIMEVYENGVRIQGISFKKEDASSYENKVVVTKDIFLP